MQTFIFFAILAWPLFLLANDTPNDCEPDWKFFGWSRANCALDGGTQETGHSHLPDNSGCVYYYPETKYFLGIPIETRTVQVTQPCID